MLTQAAKRKQPALPKRTEPAVASPLEDDVSDYEFGGRLVLRDGTAEVDLAIDLENEWISLKQGDRLLGRFAIDEVVSLRWDEKRFVMSFAGESADFYPLRPDEFVAALLEQQGHR